MHRRSCCSFCAGGDCYSLSRLTVDAIREAEQQIAQAMRLLQAAQAALRLAKLGQPAATPPPRTTIGMTHVLLLVQQAGGSVTDERFREIIREAGYKDRTGPGTFLRG